MLYFQGYKSKTPKIKFYYLICVLIDNCAAAFIINFANTICLDLSSVLTSLNNFIFSY